MQGAAMPVVNSDVARIFNQMADLLEIDAANPFRVRAYRNAARTLSSLGKSVSEMVEKGEDLSELPGIGEDLAGKIREIVETGSLSQLEEVEEKTPAELSKLMKIPGLGPKRVGLLHKELGISSIEDLQKRAEEKKIGELKGFGKKTEATILEGVQEVSEREERIKLAEVEETADALLTYLGNVKGIKELTVAGSYRRRKETVGDLDILVACRRDSKVMEAFVAYDDVDKVVSRGKTRSSVILRSGLQIDLRKVSAVSYGAALHYFTGSKPHNIAVRKLGVNKGIKINEYGVFRGEKRIAGKTEEEVFKAVDLPYIEPELREDQGEIAAAKKGDLPSLVTVDHIRGDLHSHTKETDGHDTLKQMVAAAKERGYEYLAVTDHSKRVSMAHGLDPKRLKKQTEAIDRLNAKLKDFVVLKGIEVDILDDGSLDLPNEILDDLDIVVCSVHYNRSLSRDKQTDRIMKAMDNPRFHILAHPTGRLINERGPFDLDLERIMERANEAGCFLEVNGNPDRLDLDDRYCRMAKDVGVKVVISTDAHRTADLDFMRFGVYQARRGWLEPKDVVNTRNLKDLKSLLKR
jgi:DNA polymerase (family 10)